MKWKSLLVPVVILAAAAPVQAQSLVGTYLRCSTADEGEADFIMNEVLADVYDRHVEAGGILGWGYIEHQVGGPWRRIITITAEDTPTLMEHWGQITNEIQEEHPNAWHRFNEICDSHDDYVWNLVSASDPAQATETPDAWVSTYWQCDEAAETRADELMGQMTGVFDEHIAAGQIGGWGWYAHELGGEYRRLLTVASADDFDLTEGRAMVVEALQADHAELLAEFSSICNGHVDYMWANARDEG